MTQKSEPKLLHARAEANKLLTSLGIDDPSGVEIEDIAAFLGIEVVEGVLNGAEARLVRLGNKGRIRVRQGIPSIGQRRFTIAHEIGHWQLHKEQSQLYTCLSSDIHGYAGSALELEANGFGAELLMPKRFIRERYGDSARTLELIGTVAKEMETSFTATTVRLVETSRDPYMAVFSKGGTVQWWRASPQLSGVWLRRRQQIDQDSPTWAAEQGAPACQAQQVRPETWFEHLDHCDRLEVFEQALLLKSYDTTITIISCLEQEDIP